jgi:hypothetical protein
MDKTRLRQIELKQQDIMNEFNDTTNLEMLAVRPVVRDLCGMIRELTIGMRREKHLNRKFRTSK